MNQSPIPGRLAAIAQGLPMINLGLTAVMSSLIAVAGQLTAARHSLGGFSGGLLTMNAGLMAVAAPGSLAFQGKRPAETGRSPAEWRENPAEWSCSPVFQPEGTDKTGLHPQIQPRTAAAARGMAAVKRGVILVEPLREMAALRRTLVLQGGAVPERLRAITERLRAMAERFGAMVERRRTMAQPVPAMAMGQGEMHESEAPLATSGDSQAQWIATIVEYQPLLPVRFNSS